MQITKGGKIVFKLIGGALLIFSLLFPWAINAKDKNPHLNDNVQQEIIRAISSEYATLKVALPINKHGLTLDKNGKFDWKKNEEALLHSGQYIAVGLQVQITKVDFKKNKLVLELNGGGKKKKRILEVSSASWKIFTRNCRIAGFFNCL